MNVTRLSVTNTGLANAELATVSIRDRGVSCAVEEK